MDTRSIFRFVEEIKRSAVGYSRDVHSTKTIAGILVVFDGD
jgi:hypothetical protein